MCRHNSYFASASRHQEYYSLEDANFDDREYFNPEAHLTAGYSDQPIIINHPTRGGLVSIQAHWGIVPGYAKEPDLDKAIKDSARYVNARAETVQESRLYGPLIKSFRCLIPSTGFWDYHYDKVTVQLKTKIKEEDRKTAMLVRKKGEDIFSIAGLFTFWKSRAVEGKIFKSFTMITTDANEAMRLVHNGGENPFRMPLTLTREQEMLWLNPTITDLELSQLLGYHIPSRSLTAWPTKSPAQRDAPKDETLFQQIDVPGLVFDSNFDRFAA